MPVTVTYSSEVSSSDPKSDGVVVVGKKESFDLLKENAIDILVPKLGGVISKQTLTDGINRLGANNTAELYFNNFTLACMPSKCSRHNAPMLPHSLSTLVKSCVQMTPKQYVVVVCKRKSAFALGCAVARNFPLYNRKSDAADDVNLVVEFIFPEAKDNKLTQDELNCLQSTSESIRLSAKIVDAPCNEMHTDAFLDEVRAVAKELKIADPLIYQDQELVERGFGGIYGVGKAAVHKPALAVLSHKPDGATKTFAWCGKGIVYDTGGLSIKDRNNMVGMKRDCGGAAAILGAFRSAVQNGFTENLHAVFCLAENAVGPHSARPDDVHTLYSGLTVEINNTDAEGRLVLGDGVAYAKKDLGADVIVDMATLTGAQGIATGAYHGAIMTNNEDWELGCMEAGKISGDLVFPVPYSPELHFDEFNSQIADMKNSVKNRSNAQVSCAGLFIGSHIGFSYEGIWLHADIAAPVKKNELATGYGVALLLALFGKFSRNPMLTNIGPKL